MDWIEWHKQYNDPDSELSRRLVAVRKRIAEALDRAPAGPIRVASMCAGDGRDLLEVLETHPRVRDVSGRLVELNPQLAERARARAPASIEVLCGDAGNSEAYEGAAPVDLLLCCGVLGNITNEDIQKTIAFWPRLCAPGAIVFWTRGASEPDLREEVRGWVREAGFEELSFDGLGEKYGVGVAKMIRPSEPYQRGVQFFRFVAKRQAVNMSTDQTTDKSHLLSDLPRYVYGTTRLGDETIPFEERVKVARAAMDGTNWFHTSHTYGDALQVLRAAFDQDRTRVPKLIVKIGWSRADELRAVIHQNLDPLGLDGLELGQLCLSGELAEDYASGGECYETFSEIKREGLVKRFVLEVFPWTSEAALRALRGGYPEGIVDGYILYLNPLQRFASNELWEMLVRRDKPMIAMRTVAGGNIHKLRDVPGYAWKPYLQERAAEVAPIFERSGILSWTEFCVRFAHSFPQVRATVGATSHTENLNEFLSAAEDIKLLPRDIQDEITQLHSRWSDEMDMQAEIWTL